MLDIRFVRDNADLVARRLGARGAEIDLSGFLAADARRREMLQRIETLRAERNRFSAEIASLKRECQEVAPERFSEMKRIAADIKVIEQDLTALEDQSSGFLLSVPNLPHESVPVGRSAADNVVVRAWGEKPAFDFIPREHDSVGEELGILDFARAARIAGARFSLYCGAGAQLERALISFMLDLHTREHGYREVLPPFLVSGQSMTGTGQLPKFFDDLFKIEGMDLFLVPTAEVPVTNIHAREVLRDEDMPIRYTAYTPCFRREAGSYGKDTRGLIRQHQFNKVELVTYARPEDSSAELEGLLRNAETVLQRLGLHYRVVELCTGDLGFSAAKTYDIEVWLPGQDAYREISSCSNFQDFQARRMDIRFKRAESRKNELVHTLNGSGLAVGRTVVAILENCQQRDGSVVVPEVLRPYMGGLERICRQTG